MLGGCLVLFGLFACVHAWLHGGWMWTLVWPGVAFVAVGVAYFANQPGVFGKRADGTLAPLSAAALLPFLALAWITWHLVRIASREPGMDALSSTLRLGRRPLRHELPAEIDHVADLTAEFRALARARRATYFPILDGAVPDRRALRRAIDSLPRSGIILIHCAQGHGRTALFASCFLIVREGMHAAAAVIAVRAARPGARMNRAQLAFVEAFASNIGDATHA